MSVHPINFRRVASCAECVHLGICSAYYTCTKYDMVISSESDANLSYVCEDYEEDVDE